MYSYSYVLTLIGTQYLATIMSFILFFFFNDTAPTEIYTLSLHDALPICREAGGDVDLEEGDRLPAKAEGGAWAEDRKSTRLNSSHTVISYAVFCLKKKKKKKKKKNRD